MSSPHLKPWPSEQSSIPLLPAKTKSRQQPGPDYAGLLAMLPWLLLCVVLVAAWMWAREWVLMILGPPFMIIYFASWIRHLFSRELRIWTASIIAANLAFIVAMKLCFG